MKSHWVFAAGLLCGAIGTSLMQPGSLRAQTAPAAAGTVVRVDESKLVVTYSNAYRIHTTAEETVIDFGFNMSDPNDAKGASLLFSVTNRVVMTYPSTKRLQQSLGSLVKRYEDKFGEITVPKSADEQPKH